MPSRLSPSEIRSREDPVGTADFGVDSEPAKVLFSRRLLLPRTSALAAGCGLFLTMRTTVARSDSILLLSAILLSCGAIAGCRFTLLANAPLVKEISDLTQRPASDTRPSLQTVSLELIFARCGSADRHLREELWGLIDEQIFDDGLRRQLHANGLRAGVITAQLPPHLAERFLPDTTAANQPAGVNPAENTGLFERPAAVRRLVQLLPGRGSEVVSAAGIPELVLLEHDDAEIRGGTYQEASAVFSLIAWPAADGRVRLEVTPTIKHGKSERTWIGEDGIFRLETGQRKNIFQRLRFEATIPTHSMIVVGCTGESASTVGDAFFRDRAGGPDDLRVLAIRPLAHAVDPMFAIEPSPENPIRE